MAKRRQETQPEAEATKPSAKKKLSREEKAAARRAAGVPWHPAWRWLISLLIVLHLAAVIVAPWDLLIPPALPPGYIPPRSADGAEPQLPPENSPLWQEDLLPQTLHGFFNPYLNLLYLNHGYEFFAPDPSGSNLVRYRIWDSEGNEVVEGEFPDHGEQWPRLFYHRHMMLAAQSPDMPPPSGSHVAQHLLKKYDGQRIHLQLLIHTVLTQEQVKSGIALDDPSTYVVIAELQETAPTETENISGEAAVTIPGERQ